MKRIVLCFDGTWNTPAEDSVPEDLRVETNVRRFFRSVAEAGPDGAAQEPWYNEGVGTAALNKLAGGAFGAGLDKHILDGYAHLVDAYEEGDEVYVLGFSRGAYTARSLVGMVRNCGLVRPGPLAAFRIGTAYGIYRTRQDGPDSEAAREFRRFFSRPLAIRFLGVWDTVGALGIPLPAMQKLEGRFYEFHDTRLSGIVERAYQAIALDEHRADYDICLWSPDSRPSQALEQRWFCGAHADVGGGYPDRQLSDLSLRWMQDRAAEAGLGLAPVAVTPEDFRGPLHDSYREFLDGLYAASHPLHLRPVLSTRFGNEVLDESIGLRRGAGLGYAPANPALPPLAP